MPVSWSPGAISPVVTVARTLPPLPATVSEAAAGDPTPATESSFSEEARAQLKAAGLTMFDVAAINLRDQAAVSAALYEARAERWVGDHPPVSTAMSTDDAEQDGRSTKKSAPPEPG